jgi:hypothetical protein
LLHSDSFATFFWPREGVSYQKLQTIHAKMINVSRTERDDTVFLIPLTVSQATTQPVVPQRKSTASTNSSSRKKANKPDSGNVHHPLKKIKLTHRAGETTDDQMEE